MRMRVDYTNMVYIPRDKVLEKVQPEETKELQIAEESVNVSAENPVPEKMPSHQLPSFLCSLSRKSVDSTHKPI